MKYPRILVISNQCLSQSTSNGRTLGLLLKGWPRSCIAQFCLDLQDPDWALCNNYFAVSDYDAVKALLFKKIVAKREVSSAVSKQRSAENKIKISRTAFNMLLRNFVWSTNAWKKSSFDSWVDDYNPELIIFQSGDATFMCNLAKCVSKRKNIPLIVFNTEGYYFFNVTWFHKHWSDFLCFPIYKVIYRTSFRKMMQTVSYSVYLNSKLQEDYNKEFGDKSVAIYTGSSCKFEPKKFNFEHPRFSYLGNLGINRPLALIEIAEALYSINKNYHLDVYGKLSQRDEHVFDNCPAIHYCGSINYDMVKKVIKESDVLFHAEYSVGQWINTLQYAFSTKIADSLASGSNFFLYAPPFLACSKYIIENKAAWYAKDKEHLIPVLRDMLTNDKQRQQYLDNARMVASKNHDSIKNKDRFQKILLAVKFENEKYENSKNGHYKNTSR